MKKIIFISFFLVMFTGSNAQPPVQDGSQISSLILMPFHQRPASEGMQQENRIEVDFKIDQPEMVSNAVIILKKSDTGAEIKTVTIDFIEEEGLIRYIHDSRKRALNRNHGSVLVFIGEELFENLSAEAYIVDKNGNQSMKAHY